MAQREDASHHRVEERGQVTLKGKGQIEAAFVTAAGEAADQPQASAPVDDGRRAA